MKIDELSNCHLRAWEKFRSGEAAFMCVRFTAYSRAPSSVVSHWAWRYSLGLVGTLVQWLAWPLTHVGEMLRTGRWYHATWIVVKDNQHWEYVPDGVAKRARIFPPVLFRGVERLVPKSDDDPQIAGNPTREPANNHR